MLAPSIPARSAYDLVASDLPILTVVKRSGIDYHRVMSTPTAAPAGYVPVDLVTRVVINHPDAGELRKLTIAAFIALLDYRPLGKITCHERNGLVLVDIVNDDIPHEHLADSIRPKMLGYPLLMDADEAPDDPNTPWVLLED